MDGERNLLSNSFFQVTFSQFSKSAQKSYCDLYKCGKGFYQLKIMLEFSLHLLLLIFIVMDVFNVNSWPPRSGMSYRNVDVLVCDIDCSQTCLCMSILFTNM